MKPMNDCSDDDSGPETNAQNGERREGIVGFCVRCPTDQLHPRSCKRSEDDWKDGCNIQIRHSKPSFRGRRTRHLGSFALRGSFRQEARVAPGEVAGALHYSLARKVRPPVPVLLPTSNTLLTCPLEAVSRKVETTSRARNSSPMKRACTCPWQILHDLRCVWIFYAPSPSHM